MKTVAILAAALVLCFTATAVAQVDCSCAPPAAPQAYYQPTVTYYQPAPLVYSPYVVARPVYPYAAARPVYPYAAARPVYTYRPIIAAPSVPSAYILGRGVIGQPTVYIPGQPVRNVLRYVSP